MLMTANAISMVGNVIALIAIPWFVLQTTNSPAKTGITGSAITLAAVVATFFGGTIVDRLGFKRTSVIADIASGTAFALIPLLYATTGLQYGPLLGLVFAGNFLDAPGTTAREALIPDLAGEAGMSLERASALIQAVERGSRMVGAPLAGGLIALIGAQNVLWIDAASFAVSAILIGLAVPARKAQPKPAGEPTNYLAEMRAGLQFILRDQLLLAIVLVVIVSNFIDTPLSGVIYPVYFRRFFNSSLDLGLVVAASGGGALVTALIFGAIGQRLPRRELFIGGFLVTVFRYFVYALIPPFWALFAVALVTGLGAGPINPVISTISYERTPVELRGRVLGSITALAYVAMPLGSVLGGLALEWMDIRLLLVVMGGLYLVTILGATLLPAVRGMNVRPEAEKNPLSVLRE